MPLLAAIWIGPILPDTMVTDRELTVRAHALNAFFPVLLRGMRKAMAAAGRQK